MSPEENTSRLALYQRVCESYHEVDDFRMKLLGLLPLATGTGVFLLLSGKAELIGQNDEMRYAMGAIGIFGFFFTLGLYCYEMFGIKKCHYLIVTGKKLEDDLNTRGQFLNRPPFIARYIAEPFASSIIYPASMASWLFLALFFVISDNGYRWIAAVVPFILSVLFFILTLWGAGKIKNNQEEEDKLCKQLYDNGPIGLSQLQKEYGSKHHLKALCRRLKERGVDIDGVEDIDKDNTGHLQLRDGKCVTAQGGGDQAEHKKAKPGSSGKD